jgi:phage tail-like protein
VGAGGISVWQANDGTSEGRIRPAGWTPPDGLWVFCLGSDEPGFAGRLKVGDNVVVSQAGQYPETLLTLRARTRGPSSVPDQCWWEAAVLVGGTAVVVHRVDPGQTLDYSDLGWVVVASASGSVGFSLTLRGPTALVVDAELPAFYVDDIAFAALDPTASDTHICNRFPEPNSAGALADTPISFDLFPGTANPSAITILVNGRTAYTAGAFTAEFSGPRSSQGPVNGAQHWVVDPIGVWNDAESLTVIVSSTDPASATVSWSFDAEKTSGPKPVSVIALGYQQIRVNFDEPPLAVSASNPGDALNPAGYAIARTPGVVSVQPTVVSVTQVADLVFDLATDLELSAGAPYTLTIEDVVDLLGNATTTSSPWCNVAFVSWTPPVPAGRSFVLYDMIAQKNRNEDQTGELRTFLAMFQDCVDLLAYEVDSFPEILDPNTAPEQYVDAMLADMGNPFDFDLTLTQKRQLVQLLLPIYEQKGTPQGIENAIRLFLGIEVTHVAWGIGARLDGAALLGNGWDSAEPGTFVLGSTVGPDPFGFVLETPDPPTGTLLAQADAIVAYMQRGECYFLGFRTGSGAQSNPVVLDGPDGTDSVLGDGVGGTFPGTFILH